MSSERIHEAAAIKHGIVYSVPRPQRHCHVLWLMNQMGVWHHNAITGFTTTWGRFVDRKEGARIATEQNQYVAKPTYHDMLFSEEVWEGDRELFDKLLRIEQIDSELRSRDRNS